MLSAENNLPPPITSDSVEGSFVVFLPSAGVLNDLGTGKSIASWTGMHAEDEEASSAGGGFFVGLIIVAGWERMLIPKSM